MADRNTPPEESALIAELRPFTFQGKSLADEMSDTYEFDEEDMELDGPEPYRFVVKKLLDCDVNEVHEILSQHKTIIRDLELKEFWTKNGEVMSELKWDRREHFVGLARHLFLGRTNKTDCEKCKKHNNYGPFEKCIVVGTKVSERACTNCFYKGEATNCTLRKAYEKREEKKTSERVPFSAKTIRRCKVRDLERVLAWVQAEIAARKAAM